MFCQQLDTIIGLVAPIIFVIENSEEGRSQLKALLSQPQLEAVERLYLFLEENKHLSEIPTFLKKINQNPSDITIEKLNTYIEADKEFAKFISEQRDLFESIFKIISANASNNKRRFISPLLCPNYHGLDIKYKRDEYIKLFAKLKLTQASASIAHIDKCTKIASKIYSIQETLDICVAYFIPIMNVSINSPAFFTLFLDKMRKHKETKTYNKKYEMLCDAYNLDYTPFFNKDTSSTSALYLKILEAMRCILKNIEDNFLLNKHELSKMKREPQYQSLKPFETEEKRLNAKADNFLEYTTKAPYFDSLHEKICYLHNNKETIARKDAELADKITELYREFNSHNDKKIAWTDQNLEWYDQYTRLTTETNKIKNTQLVEGTELDIMLSLFGEISKHADRFSLDPLFDYLAARPQLVTLLYENAAIFREVWFGLSETILTDHFSSKSKVRIQKLIPAYFYPQRFQYFKPNAEDRTNTSLPDIKKKLRKIGLFRTIYSLEKLENLKPRLSADLLVENSSTLFEKVSSSNSTPPMLTSKPCSYL